MYKRQLLQHEINGTTFDLRRSMLGNTSHVILKYKLKYRWKVISLFGISFDTTRRAYDGISHDDSFIDNLFSYNKRQIDWGGGGG